MEMVLKLFHGRLMLHQDPQWYHDLLNYMGTQDYCSSLHKLLFPLLYNLNTFDIVKLVT